MASRRNPMRPVPRLRDVLERIERNEVKRRLLGMPVADPFLDLDLGTSPDAAGAAPAAVAPFGFLPTASSLSNPRTARGSSPTAPLPTDPPPEASCDELSRAIDFLSARLLELGDELRAATSEDEKARIGQQILQMNFRLFDDLMPKFEARGCQTGFTS